MITLKVKQGFKMPVLIDLTAEEARELQEKLTKALHWPLVDHVIKVEIE